MTTTATERTATAVAAHELPRGWNIVRFEDMAENITDRVDNPSDAGVQRYVGLEHLDPDSLRIRRWGAPGDVEATKLRFQPGDIIFGRRRAYQRKLAVADFEGICSAHALVLRARQATVVPDFLPFFMQGETFFQCAMAISVGSLSPTINWRTLALQEFAIPPKEEQRRIAEILWAAEEALARHRVAQAAVHNLLESCLAKLLGVEPAKHPEQWKRAKLQDLCDSPITYGIVQAGPHVPGGIPYVRVSDMAKGKLTEDGMLRTAPDIASRFERSRVEANDLVCALRGEIGLVLKVPPELEGANLTQGTAKISVGQGVETDYVRWALRAPTTIRQLALVAKGSTFKEITLEALRGLTIPLPGRREQLRICETLDAIAVADQAVTVNFAVCSATKTRLLTALLSSR